MMKRNQVLAALALLVAMTGCGDAWKAAQWRDTANLKAPTQAEHPKHDAVYLYRNVEVFQHLGWTKPSWWVMQVHAQLVVLNESGRRYSDVRVSYDADEEIVDMAARSIAPDGTVTPLKPDKIYEDEPEDEGDSKVRVFALPKVQPGTIIEYRYAKRRDKSIFTSRTEYLWASLPSKHTRVAHTVHEWGRMTAKAYGTDKAFEVTRDGDYVTLAWEGKDLPARPKEINSPSSWDTTPRALFVMTQYAYKRVYNYNVHWADSVESEFYEPLVKERAFAAGLQLPGPVLALKSKPLAERIAGAYEYVQAIPYLGEESLAPRPLNQVIRERNADDWEKLLLLQEIFAALDVECELVLSRPVSEGTIDVSRPARSVFTEGLLYLPEQGGEKARWLQPYCSHCEAGQVYNSFQGAKGLVLTSAEKGGEPEWMEVRADQEPPTVRKEERVITISASGTATVNQTTTFEGYWGSRERRLHNKQTKLEYEKRIKAWITDKLDKAKVTSVTWGAIAVEGAPVKLECTWESDELVTRAGPRLIVDLTAAAFGGDWIKQDKRRTDLVFHTREHELRRFKLIPPAGYEIAERPEPLELKAPHAEAKSRWFDKDGVWVYEVVIDTFPGRWKVGELEPHKKFMVDLDKLRKVKLTLVKSASVAGE